MTTTCTQHEWKAADGETFSYSLWTPDLPPEERPRAVVVAVHGLSGAALDYEPLAGHLAKQGVVTYALELRGQGNDPVPQRRGDLVRIEDWFADLSAFFALVRSRHPGAQIYYYGESMGAALLTRFLAQACESDLPAGLVLASPVVALSAKPSWWQEAVFRFFLWIRPTHRIDVSEYTNRTSDDPSNWVTRDEAHRRWFETAPHKVSRFTVRFFKCLRDLIDGCFDAAPRVTVPLLLIYAANDVYIRPARVEQFFARLGSREKELRLFPESYHLLLHDYDKALALEQIESWLLRRIDLTGQPGPGQTQATTRS
ncbi:MAG: alpha/beta hydrolase [Methylacidiphilales bacterium]|nr:alpha/beta hydrolase [Candidatus Methylacidiphilales bacterium]